MNPSPDLAKAGVGRFRVKLLVAMMLVVSAVTTVGLFFAQRDLAANVQSEFHQAFLSELAARHAIQELRHGALAERCRLLALKPRIHAALEDNALDLLYPSARDELRDFMDTGLNPAREPSPAALHARFYRFLDARGKVIPAPDAREAGLLPTADEARLTLAGLPKTLQSGFLARADEGSAPALDEIIYLPIISTETGEAIAALVLGFKPVDLGGQRAAAGMTSAIWLEGKLYLPAAATPGRAELGEQLARGIGASPRAESNFVVSAGGAPARLFFKLLNPGSSLPPAYDVCLFPLGDLLARQRRLLWQFAGAGGVLLLGAFAASRFLAVRLTRPVEKLAVDSEENRTQRQRAEAALELTHGELQRSARFSADASHQLKTPVTVLRAGLEELLAGEKLQPEAREEISGLVHQTFRLTSVIEDLLLLSRMDAGRLKLDARPVNLIRLIEAWLDDLGALPDEFNLAVETDLPAGMYIEGEERYTTLILQNLLENARKYNRAGGRIRVAARAEHGWILVRIGNTGRPIPPAAHEHIFERFHRGSVGENVPGHGLGLNLARELARLHRGELRLASSAGDWTEFEVRFPVAPSAPASA